MIYTYTIYLHLHHIFTLTIYIYTYTIYLHLHHIFSGWQIQGRWDWLGMWYVWGGGAELSWGNLQDTTWKI